MDSETEGRTFTFISGLMLGAVIGAGVALLSAPQSGRRTRRQIRRAAGDAKDVAAERLEDIADEVKGRVDDVIKGARKKVAS